jgi:hypothetical protein
MKVDLRRRSGEAFGSSATRTRTKELFDEEFAWRYESSQSERRELLQP